jgi:hypothetical protein
MLVVRVTENVRAFQSSYYSSCPCLELTWPAGAKREKFEIIFDQIDQNVTPEESREDKIGIMFNQVDQNLTSPGVS